MIRQRRTPKSKRGALLRVAPLSGFRLVVTFHNTPSHLAAESIASHHRPSGWHGRSRPNLPYRLHLGVDEFASGRDKSSVISCSAHVGRLILPFDERPHPIGLPRAAAATFSMRPQAGEDIAAAKLSPPQSPLTRAGGGSTTVQPAPVHGIGRGPSAITAPGRGRRRRGSAPAAGAAEAGATPAAASAAIQARAVTRAATRPASRQRRSRRIDPGEGIARRGAGRSPQPASTGRRRGRAADVDAWPARRRLGPGRHSGRSGRSWGEGRRGGSGRARWRMSLGGRDLARS